MSFRVAIISQPNYEPHSLKRAIHSAIVSAGFDLNSVRDRRVLLKPNMLGAYPPEMGITTNPAFVKAVAEIFIEARAHLSIGDSPDGVHPLENVWEVTGIREVCRMVGAKEARFEAAGSVKRDGVWVSGALLDADFVINLPKFKTHGLTILTLAAKNLFGCVNGMQKTAHHRKSRGPQEFAEAVVRVANAVRAALTIIDGIVAMDGNGPSAGNLIDLKLVIAGTDVYAVDAACSKLVGLEPIHLDTLAAAKRMGLWDDRAPLEIVGRGLEESKPGRFNLPVTYTRGMRDWWLTRLVLRRIWSGQSVQPLIDPVTCQKCRLCVEACPVAAIVQPDKEVAPKIAVTRCTQCFCCHEVCPHRAINLKISPQIRLARWLADMRTKKLMAKA